MKKILVIGAGAYQAPLIKRISQLGIGAYCVDANPKAPGFEFADGYKILDVCDKEACLAYAKELCVNGVMTYGATITLPTVAYIGKMLSLPALPENTAEISKSKFKIKECLAKVGLNIKGNFFELHSVEELTDKTFTYPCVIKPSDGSGSKGVSLVNSEAELQDALDYAFKSARFGEIYCEGFVTGEEYSVEAFVTPEKIHIYAIVKSTFEKDSNGNISYGHRTPSGLPIEIEESICKEIEGAIKALEINIGSVNFDVIISDDDKKPYIIDVGIRVGQNLIASHLVPLSRGVDVMDNSIALALGEETHAEPTDKNCVATRLLIYKPGIIQKIKPFDELIGKHNIADIVLRKGVGDILPPYKEKSDTCGWVIARGSTPDEAEQNAVYAKNLLENYIIIEPKKE